MTGYRTCPPAVPPPTDPPRTSPARSGCRILRHVAAHGRLRDHAVRILPPSKSRRRVLLGYRPTEPVSARASSANHHRAANGLIVDDCRVTVASPPFVTLPSHSGPRIALPPAGMRSHRRGRKPIPHPCRQVSDVPALRVRTSSTSREISRLLDRSKSISNGVNIRGPGEILILRMSEAVEGVTGVFLPPRLDSVSVLLFELMKLLLRWGPAGNPLPAQVRRDAHGKPPAASRKAHRLDGRQPTNGRYWPTAAVRIGRVRSVRRPDRGTRRRCRSR